jgi:hypothetical protein
MGGVVVTRIIILSDIGVYLQTAGAAVSFSLHQWRNSDGGCGGLKSKKEIK